MTGFPLHYAMCHCLSEGSARYRRAGIRLFAALAALLFCSLASALPPVSIIQGFSVTNGTRTDGVYMNYTIPNAMCAGIQPDGLYRDNVNIASGWAPYLDTTAVPGVSYNYYVLYSNCNGEGYMTPVRVGMRGYPPAAFPATISATDGASTTQVTVSGVVPSQSVCGAASAQFYVYRDSVQVFTTSIPATAGIAPATPFSFVDTPPYPGHNNYYEAVVSSNCDLTNNTSGDTGWAGTSLDGSYAYAPPATSLTATNGTYPDHVDLQAVFPPMSMTSTMYRIFRDGSAISASPLTTSLFLNTTVNYTDTSPPPGPHTYSISLEGASPNALVPGYKYLVYGVSPKVSAVGSILSASPSPAAAISATDGVYSNKVVVTFSAPNQAPNGCTSTSYVVTRDGVDIASINTIPNTGGAASYDDTTLTPGQHTFGVRAVCTPGGAVANSATDTGYMAAVPAAATAVSASDGSSPAMVTVTFAAPNQSAACTSTTYVVTRDGADIYALAAIPNTGGAGNYNDTAATPGIHTYGVRSVCTPGGATSISATDTGYVLGTPSPPFAVSATDGIYASKVTVGFTAPNQSLNCSSTNYVVTRDGADIATISTIPLTGGAGNYDDTTAAPGIHTYAVRSVCSPSSTTATSGSDTGFISATPSAANSVAASDGAFPAWVRVTFTAPNQAPGCTSTNYVVTRDGSDIATISTIANTGGPGNYDDAAAPIGTHTYGVRSVCTPGGLTTASATDTGYKSGSPAVVSSLIASDGVYPNKVNVAFTAPDQSAQCSSISYVITRDAVDLTTLATIPLTGGPGNFDDNAASVGNHAYAVRSVCIPGSATATSASDTGFWRGTPTAPTSVSASDGNFTSKVAVSFTAPNQTANCTSISYVVQRNGVDVGTSTFAVLSGGAGTYDDTTAAPSTTYTYGVRAVCSPGLASTAGGTDSGYRQGTPAAPTSIAASDYAYGDHIAVSVVVPNDSAQCTTRDIILARDGTDITTITGVSTTGGTGSYDDYAAPMGLRSYTARSVCNPGSAVSSTVTDTGARSFLGLTCGATSPASASMLYSPGATNLITATSVQNASLVRMRAYANVNGTNDLFYYPMAAAGPDYVGTVALVNHASGNPEYGTVTVEILGTGMNPGDPETVCSSTTFNVVQQCAVPSLTGPQGIGALPATLGWSADSATSNGWTLYESAALAGPYVSIGSYGSVAVTASVAGWPHKFYKLQCNASAAIGNRTSAPVEVWGDPAPVVTPQSFSVNNPGSAVVTPVVTDADGGTTFVLTVTTAPLHGTTSVTGGSVTYTPFPGYAGPDVFTVTATDPGGASGFALMSATVSTPVPATPSLVAASDGLFVGRVDITWGAAASSQGYRVFLGTSPTDPAPLQIADVTSPTLIYSDAAAPAGALRYYSVLAYNGAMLSPRSIVDAGYADTPITGVSASGSTPPTTSIDLVPVYNDPDPGDTPVFSIATQPANGVALMVGNKVHYVPNGTFVGDDPFQITGTDRAGAANTGTATVNVGCAAPTAGAIAVAPGRIIVGSGYTVSDTYNTVSCPQAFSAAVRILSGATVVDSSTLPIPNGAGLPVSFNLGAPPTAGSYVVELTIANTVTGATVVKTAPLTVVAFRPPAMSWAPASPLQSVETALVNLGSSPDCSALTTDAAAAQADTAKCLIESSGLPAGVNLVGTPATAPWKGVPATAGTYAASFSISKYDSVGIKRHFGDVPLPVTVASLAAFQFTSPSVVNVKEYTGTYSISPAQSSGPLCTLFSVLAAAQAQAIGGGHACLVEYGTLPSDAYAAALAINGAAFDMATRTVSWTVSIVDNAGAKYQVSTGSTSIVPTATDLVYDLQVNPATPYAIVTNVSVSPKSTGADTCTLTAQDAVAQNSTAVRCLFEYSPVSGLAIPNGSPDPILRGTLPNYPVTSIAYTVSVYSNGVKHTVVSGSKDVTTLQPLPPPISLEHVRQIAPDTYAVSVLGGAFGVLSTSTAQGVVDGTSLVAGDATPAAFSLSGAKTKQVLYASPGSLYAARTVDISLLVRTAPTMVTNKTVTVVSVPRDGLRLRLNSPPHSAPDTAPLVVTATVVQVTTSGLAYVASEAGDWTVAFGEMTANGLFNPLTAELPIDGTGTATASLPLPPSTILRLTARATPVSAYPGYSATLTSPTTVVSIVKGTPISGTLTAISAPSGPAPFLGIMKVEFATLSDHAANQALVWSRSNDGGTTWAPIPEATSLQYAVRLDAGDAQFKVQFTNRNTSETSESPPLTLSAYGVPKLKITGPTYMLPASTATLTAQANDSNATPIPGAFYEWSISLASTPTVILSSGATATIPFAPTDPGTYRVLVRSRGPGTTASDPAAWAQAVQQIIVGVPAKPYARITGPTKVEVGTSATFTASATTSFNLASSNLTLDGQWTLPDGTTVPGTTLVWTPTAADLAVSSRPTITYTVWVTGYQAATTFTQSASLSLWQYVWPTWRVTSAVGGTVAPANAQFSVLADNPTLVATLEGLSYTWTVPSAIAVTGTPASKLSGIVNFGGAYSVSVVVADSRGNSTTLNGDITMTNAPPIVVDLLPQNLSKWSHAPITLGVTTKATGGHPSDAISTYSYSLDGVPSPVPSQSTARFDLSSPGSYNIRVDVLTRMGATASKTVLVNVPPNSAPSCAPTGTVATNRRSITLKANCTDPDGAITRYAWLINGVPVTLSVGASWTANLPVSQTWPVTVDVTATDDGGLTSNGSVSFP